MTKFGMSLKDELIVTISKERFEDFISPFLESLPDDEIEVTSRPSEGDLIYFPLGNRIFEIKFDDSAQTFSEYISALNSSTGRITWIAAPSIIFNYTNRLKIY